MSYQRIDRQLNAEPWPSLEVLKESPFQPGDVFLICGGFEDRVMATLKMAQSSNVRDINVLNFEYTPNLEQNHFPEMASLCADAGWKHAHLQYDRCNPAGAFAAVMNSFPTEGKRLLIDISGMSRLLIVQLIVGIIEQRFPLPVIVLYAEAESYPPSEAEAQEELSKAQLDSATLLSFISTGVYDLAVVPELASTNLNRAPIRLVAFPSFNPSQLLSVRSSIQPSRITLVHGAPPDPNLSWRTEIICKLNQINGDSVCDSVITSTLDYTECLKFLLQLYDQWAEFNSLVVSPTGSKMQTIAVGIFRGFVSDIQIIYPTPLRFTNPDGHTRGVKQMYQLDLTRFVNIREKLISE